MRRAEGRRVLLGGGRETSNTSPKGSCKEHSAGERGQGHHVNALQASYWGLEPEKDDLQLVWKKWLGVGCILVAHWPLARLRLH